MADSSSFAVVRPSFRRHNSYVQFSFIPNSSETNSYKLTRLNSIFEKAADRRLGGIRADKIVRLLPTSAISREKYLSILGDLGIDLESWKSKHKSKKGHHARLRVISRGPFLAMFAYESVSFLNLFAVNEKADREKRLEHRRSLSKQKLLSESKVNVNMNLNGNVTPGEPRERSNSAPPSNTEATEPTDLYHHEHHHEHYRERKHRSKHKRRRKKKLGHKEKHKALENQRLSKSKSHPNASSKPEPLVDLDVNVEHHGLHSNKAHKMKQKRTLRRHSSNSIHPNNTNSHLTAHGNGKFRERHHVTSDSFSSHSSEDASRKRLENQHPDESALDEIKPISYSYSSSSSESEMPSPPKHNNNTFNKPKNQRKKKHYDVYDRLLQIDVDFSNLSIKEQEQHMELQRKMYNKYRHNYIAHTSIDSPKYGTKDFKQEVDKLGECVFFRQVSSFITKLFPPRGSAVVGVAPSPELGYSAEHPRTLPPNQTNQLLEKPLPHLIHRRQSA